MLADTNNVQIHFERSNLKNPSLITVVFLHGFSGSSNDWQQVINMLPVSIQCCTIDLIGHGRSPSPEDVSLYSTNAVISQINSVFIKLKLQKVVLVGYSLGGRAALSFALKKPEIIKGLILESTTPGIIEESLRTERKNSDDKLAELIERDGIEKFTDYWMSLPVFETQKKLPFEKLRQVRKDKLNNSSMGLANSLRGFGQGVMPHLWNELTNIYFDVLLITGELDSKYTMLNSQMLSKIKNAEHKIISGAGHNIHLEKPEVFVSLLKDFIVKFS